MIAPTMRAERGQDLLADDPARELTRARHHHTPALFVVNPPAIASEGYRRPGGQAGRTGHPDAEAFRT